MPTTKHIHLLLPDDLLERVDAARGLVPKCAWVREAVEEKLENDAYAQRGKWAGPRVRGREVARAIGVSCPAAEAILAGEPVCIGEDGLRCAVHPTTPEGIMERHTKLVREFGYEVANASPEGIKLAEMRAECERLQRERVEADLRNDGEVV